MLASVFLEVLVSCAPLASRAAFAACASIMTPSATAPRAACASTLQDTPPPSTLAQSQPARAQPTQSRGSPSQLTEHAAAQVAREHAPDSVSDAASDVALSERDRLLVYAGAFDFEKPEWSHEFGLELRFGAELWTLQPFVGLNLFEGGSAYLYGGLRREFELGRSFYLAPSLAAGLFNEDGIELGGLIEFRSALELGYRWRGDTRISLSGYHVSNGGLYDTNGGGEALVLGIDFDLASWTRACAD